MTERRDANQPPLSSWPSNGRQRPEGPRLSGEAPEVEGYEISGLLGYGGMGTVWSATQLSTRRDVALKLLERGALGSEKARGRFEREVELTARLQHPNIAVIYDSGVHQGRYYYAMELIDGVPLDKYVEDHHLTQRQTLELMRTVCEALQHAHQSGVIHRDLKPSNILVTPDGQPHVLDFGLAKAFLEGDSDLSLSADGVPAGTPAYMSPEQAAGHLEQIDTRTDVYSLGVILFRLLTGKPPHDLSGTAYDVVHRIVEEEVRRPREITKEVNRELEALLLKALAHDPKDRYPSAGDLARDIKNYLTGEPLTARPPTTAYFLRKRIRKYRVPVAIACAVLAAFIGMGVFAYVRIVRARDEAQKEADKGNAVYRFVRNILTSQHRWQTTSDEALHEAARDVGSKYAGQPEVEAAVRDVIGAVYLARGQLDIAEPHLRRAVELRGRVLGEGHPETLSSMNNLAVMLFRKGKLDEVEALDRRMLMIRRRVLGKKHRDTLQSMDNLGRVLEIRGKLDEAEAMFGRCVEIRQRVIGEADLDTLWSLTRLSNVLEKAGKLEEADAMNRRHLEIRRRVLGEEDPDTLWAMNRLAVTLWDRGKLDEAEAMNRRNLEIRRRIGGDEDPHTLWAMGNLALVLEEGGKINEAEGLRREELEIRKRLVSERHRTTLPPLAEGPAVKSEGRDDTVSAARGEVDVLAYDDFDGKLGLDWKILHPDPSHFSLTKNPGTLTITTQHGSFFALNTDYENLFLIDCPAAAGQDFQVTTCISSFKPVADYNQAGLIFYNNKDDYLKFVCEYSSSRGGLVFNALMETEGSFGFGTVIAHQESGRGWLRITKRGNRYTFSTSSDGRTFLPIKYPDLDYPGLFQRGVVWGDGSVRAVGLLAKNGSLSGSDVIIRLESRAPEVDASFDFFEVRSVSAKYERTAKAARTSGEETNVESR